MELFATSLLLFSGFWALPFIPMIGVAVLLLSLISTTDKDFDNAATFWLFLSVAGLVVLATSFGDWHAILNYVLSYNFGWFVFEYSIIGFIWMSARWWLYVKKAAQKIANDKESLLKEFNSHNYGMTFEEYLVKYNGLPTVKTHKWLLTTSLVLWPFSFIRWSTVDFIKFLADWIVDTFGGIFTRIRNSVLSSYGLGADTLSAKSTYKTNQDTTRGNY